MRVEIFTLGNFEFESRELTTNEYHGITRAIQNDGWVTIPVEGYPNDRSISIKVSNIVTFEKIGK